MIRTLAAFAAALCLAGPAASQTVQQLDPATVSERWPQGEVNWSRGRGDVVYALAYARSPQGFLILCGVVQFKGGTKGGRSIDVLKSLEFEINNRRVVRGFDWMPIVRSGQSLVGQQADCRGYTAIPVPEGATFGVNLSQRRF